MNRSATPSALERLTTTSLIYIVISLVAAAIAIALNLPAQPMGEGSGTGRPVLQEFLVGGGTGMSAGLYWLAIQAVLTYFARRLDRWGTLSVGLLALQALLAGIFGTTEPVFRKVFNPATFNPLLAAVEAALLVIALLMVAFSVLELLRRRRSPQAG